LAYAGLITKILDGERDMVSVSSLRLLAGVAALAALSACGSDKPAEKPADVTAEAAPAPAAEAPAAPAADAPAAEAPAAVTFASLTGDAAAGERIFGQCKACHVAEAGVNRVGPSLWGVVGRKAGSIEGFKYSKANLNSGLVWTEEQLFTYLEAPQRTVPGQAWPLPA
jgi:cytochrome c